MGQIESAQNQNQHLRARKVPIIDFGCLLISYIEWSENYQDHSDLSLATTKWVKACDFLYAHTADHLSALNHHLEVPH